MRGAQRSARRRKLQLVHGGEIVIGVACSRRRRSARGRRRAGAARRPSSLATSLTSLRSLSASRTGKPAGYSWRCISPSFSSTVGGAQRSAIEQGRRTVAPQAPSVRTGASSRRARPPSRSSNGWPPASGASPCRPPPPTGPSSRAPRTPARPAREPSRAPRRGSSAGLPPRGGCFPRPAHRTRVTPWAAATSASRSASAAPTLLICSQIVSLGHSSSNGSTTERTTSAVGSIVITA